MKLRGVIPTTIDVGVKQRLESLSQAVSALSPVGSYTGTLPSAGASSPGDFVVLRASNGVSTLYVCFLNSSGVNEWQPVTQSS